MPVYDGNKAAQEHLMPVSKHCIQAALNAPQVTGRLKLMTEIITGEELTPMVKIYEELAKTKNVVYVIVYRMYKALYEQGEMPVMLLFGADLSQSPGMEWNCGACGFKTCLEFDKYSREHRGMGTLGGGPSCNWMALDFGIACDWACAAAYQYNIPARIESFGGVIFKLLGHMPETSCTLTLPLGPCKEHVYLVRYGTEMAYTYEEWKNAMLNVGVGLFQMFSGFKPQIKGSNKWWEKPPQYYRVAEDPEFDKLRGDIRKKLFEIAQEYRDKKTLSENSILNKL